MATRSAIGLPANTLVGFDDDRLLWGVALFYYGLGDFVTTVVGLQFENVAEVGPIAGPLVAHYGLASLFWLKLVVLFGFYAVWYALPRPHSIAVPAALSVTGLAVTAWNLAVISAAVL